MNLLKSLCKFLPMLFFTKGIIDLLNQLLDLFLLITPLVFNHGKKIYPQLLQKLFIFYQV